MYHFPEKNGEHLIAADSARFDTGVRLTGTAFCCNDTPLGCHRPPLACLDTPLCGDDTPLGCHGPPLDCIGTPLAGDGTPLGCIGTPLCGGGTPLACVGTRLLRSGIAARCHLWRFGRMFFRVLLPAFLLPLLAVAAPATPDRILKLWAGKAPGDFSAPGPETITPPKPTDKLPISRLTNVAEPRLEFYLPAKPNGAAVIVVPGGGFGILASEHEGSELCTWLRDRGFVAAVLQHRCPTNKLPKPWEFPAQDTQRAISLLRSKAEELQVQPDRIGLFGFSAGGQVALIATTNASQRLYPVADAVDAVSCRPDFLMLCYAWKILADGSTTELKPEIKIDANTPPTFIAQAYDDPGSLAEGSTLAFLALRKAKVPAELHIYSTGGHGFGLRPNATQAPGDWPGRLELWLRARDLLSKK